MGILDLHRGLFGKERVFPHLLTLVVGEGATAPVKATCCPLFAFSDPSGRSFRSSMLAGPMNLLPLRGAPSEQQMNRYSNGKAESRT